MCVLLWNCQFGRNTRTAADTFISFLPRVPSGQAEKRQESICVRANRSLRIKSDCDCETKIRAAGVKLATRPIQQPPPPPRASAAQRQILKARRPPIAWVSFCVRFGRLHLSSFIWKRRAGVLLKPSQTAPVCVRAAFVHLYATAFFLLCVCFERTRSASGNICVMYFGKFHFESFAPRGWSIWQNHIPLESTA